MPHKSGIPKSKYPPSKVKQERREMGPEGQGSSGDIRDRFRDTYKPGANPPPKPGLMNPLEAIRRMRKKKPKPAK